MLFLESEVAEAALKKLGQPAMSRPSLRLRGGTWYARYRFNGKQREISFGTVDEFEARVSAAALHHRLSNLLHVDGPGVYLIRVGDAIKIGRASRSIHQRVSSFKTANADDVELLAVLSTNPDDEDFYHRGMGAFRLRGEWFDASPEALALLARLLERGPR